jgi:hypothetical protein
MPKRLTQADPQLIEAHPLGPMEERANLRCGEPEGGFVRAGVAEAAGAQRDELVTGQCLDAADVERAAVAVEQVEGQRATARLDGARPVRAYQRLPAVVPQGQCPVDHAPGQRLDMRVDAVDAHGLQVPQPVLDCRNVEVVHRAILERRLVWGAIEAVALHAGNLDGAAGKPRASQTGRRGAPQQQRANAGGVAEHLVERQGHHVGVPAREVEPVGGDKRRRVEQHVPSGGLRLGMRSSGCCTPLKFDCAGNAKRFGTPAAGRASSTASEARSSRRSSPLSGA